MFTLPPLPPKDYYIKEVKQNQQSCPDITPIGLPRITQTSLAKYCGAIEYQKNDKLDNVVTPETNPKIMNILADRARAFWVTRPGKNDYFLHDISNKYSVKVEDSYDSRFKHKECVFYRSFKYEMDCMKDARLQKVYRKAENETREEREKLDDLQRRRIEEREKKTIDDMGLKSCREKPPFWWKDENVEVPPVAPPIQIELPKYEESNVFQPTYVRWQDEPDLLKFALADPCMRRDNMALINQPFHSEACNWYYVNYPQPPLRRLHKRFV